MYVSVHDCAMPVSITNGQIECMGSVSSLCVRVCVRVCVCVRARARERASVCVYLCRHYIMKLSNMNGSIECMGSVSSVFCVSVLDCMCECVRQWKG